MRNILIIDNDASLARTLELYFQGRGYSVMVASEAKGGLALWRDKDPDLVLLDVQLPGLDGPKALARAKNEGLSGEVIMVSASQDTEAALSAIQAGAADYLYKPLDLDSLDVLITRLKVVVLTGREETLT